MWSGLTHPGRHLHRSCCFAFKARPETSSNHNRRTDRIWPFHQSVGYSPDLDFHVEARQNQQPNSSPERVSVSAHSLASKGFLLETLSFMVLE